MVRKLNLPALPALRVLTGCFVLLCTHSCSHSPELSTYKAELRKIEVVISTNGVIEPVSGTEIYAPVDGFIKAVHCTEGSDVVRGQSLLQLDAAQARISLAEARASLLEARRQAQIVLSGPTKGELDPLKASARENELQLQQVEDDLATETLLYKKGAVSNESVERLTKQKQLLEIRAKALEQERENLLARYSKDEKEWEQEKVDALTNQVKLLERQVRDESITAPAAGTFYALSVKTGAFVNRGQLIGRIYQPGQVRLRAYVDEPDLGRIHQGQPVTIEWDGMPDTKWSGLVQSPADQVVELNNRSIGQVLCSIDGQPKELIPNTNVKVKIAVNLKPNALLVPRSALFSHEDKPAVFVYKNSVPEMRQVELGLVNSEEIEILKGIAEGDSIVTNPEEIQAQK